MKRFLVAAVLVLFASATLADGKAIFGSKCAACHGPDGKGATAMGKKLGVKDLTVTKLSAAEIEETVTKGRGKMTPFGGKLQPNEIKDVAGFVKGGLK
jgi:cytochrome c oxidase cbb3-type subunit 3